MLDGYVQGETELVEPYPVELGRATPFIARMPGAAEWLTYHHKRLPVTRHALAVLESVDAIDLVFETLVCGLLAGEMDTTGYPEYNAIVGGVASHFDEATGDMIVRAVVGWGGKGVRGDTDRNAARTPVGHLQQHAGGHSCRGRRRWSSGPSPAAVGQGASCAPTAASTPGHERAFYCPKCGMRMLRG